MMKYAEKLAYLKGLAEGLDIDRASKEGKVLLAVMDVLEEMVSSISCLEYDVDNIIEELDFLEEELSFEDEGEDEDFFLPEEYIDYDGEIYEVVCPSCNEVVYLDEEMLDEGQIACPACGTSLEIDFTGEIDDEE